MICSDLVLFVVGCTSLGRFSVAGLLHSSLLHVSLLSGSLFLLESAALAFTAIALWLDRLSDALAGSGGAFGGGRFLWSHGFAVGGFKVVPG